MRRFIIPVPVITEEAITISGDLFHHMVRVLRMKSGARVCLVDGSGHEYAGVIHRINGESVTIALEDCRQGHATISGPAITLFQGLPRGDKLDFILQKCTELGAAGIVPFAAERSIARVPSARLEDKLERWRRIAREAARQSGRDSVPDIYFAADLAGALHLASHHAKFFLWEQAKPGTLKNTLAGTDRPERLAIIIGPEGGFSAEEAASAMKCGAIPVSLGRRIVRTETAGIAILAILQFHWGDIG